MTAAPHGDGKNFSVPPVIAFWGLLIKYMIMIAYGLTAFGVGIPTFNQLTGDVFELIWPLAISFLAAASAAGVIVSWWTDKHTGLEHTATLALVSLLGVYSIALVVRGFTDPGHGSWGTAWLPPAFCVFPTIRVVMLQVRRSKAKARARLA